ncbi:LRR receptor-like serine/threonine-protein kinase GSO1 [Selaginella moellendorffii]|uniref:LRR receptor-like serine/threonine-protein kinase GSO1 n=1 Tax=Selaginella moellendorffii TaxID=88036 RepID=UPI000D1CE375|nr:LRR receptor-like serine/threonine-protein kinase GSO1 [Selaginella moellendorffii]|eukprot:XP_024518272.1 LRR receptor-like serine/threonine-protein kinase GSO1 [Selaginella moellendorffii]
MLLVMLDLGGLNLEGIISPEVSRLKNLEVLHLSLNNLVGPLPKEFGMMKKLKTLYLPCEIPEFIGNLSSLEVIWADIAIGEIPRSIGQLKNLRHVEISFGYIFGSIPEELGNCSKLEEIHIFPDNIIESVTHASTSSQSFVFESFEWYWGNPKRNMELDSFGGSYSKTLLLDKLISINYNMFSGTIPLSLGQMGGLINLNLRNNRFTGSIPASLGHLSNLNELHLGNNLLTGAIPINLRQLLNLKFLELSNNSLNGSLSYILTTTSIEYLDLSDNKFNGHMPPISRDMQFLFLSNNMLTGEILGISIGPLCNLNYLDVSGNRLVGGLPNWLKHCTNLIFLRVDNNSLSGKLGADVFKSMTNLQYVSLSYNKFEGELPESLSQKEENDNFQPVDGSDSSKFGLEGKIPFGLGQMSTFDKSSYLENPGLCGKPLDKECPYNSNFTLVVYEHFSSSSWWQENVSFWAFTFGFTVLLISLRNIRKMLDPNSRQCDDTTNAAKKKERKKMESPKETVAPKCENWINPVFV